MGRRKIDREKIEETIDGYMQGRAIGAPELFTTALALVAALEQSEAEAAEMRELLREVRECRGEREFDYVWKAVAAFLDRDLK